ncbi:tripartite tricarboxylate transporter substrate binding protein [Variovorax terrae]|uniref:Tripartite tricarboxylate transporter substrate binding protein n=1 Tax=Variovorax terrae TaxID=2923278 RepID=A0A9X2AQP5_9BURK|nr:tripartite tricarboxylate transporter substrate binding protein [Variovorax terrae]MCJ0763416.1 tripartite tricarboxylate transporter substrate binding protein [Variovorax terrae]
MNNNMTRDKNIGLNLRRLLVLGSAALALLPLAARAAYPEQPINMIVAYGPGGGTDIIARVIVPYLEKYLGDGARITVLNRPGAGGAIGFSALAAAPADGYTIGFVNTPNLLTLPIERKTAFSWQSFDLLGSIVDDPGDFAVPADSPVKTLKDLIAHAKAHPGTVTVGTTGVGSDDHLALLSFERAAGVKMNHIPFKGGAEVLAALAGKQIAVGAINVGEVLQAVKGGTPLRHLGQMSVNRTALAPDVPTFREQGLDIVLASLRSIAAPKGLPPAVREKLAVAVEKAAADPKFQAQAASYFAPLRYMPPARLEADMREAEAQFRQLWKEIPWTDK